MEDKEKQILILVPKQWLESLLINALAFEEARKSWEHGNFNNDEINRSAVMLSGYAKSVKSILANNSRVEKEVKKK